MALSSGLQDREPNFSQYDGHAALEPRLEDFINFDSMNPRVDDSEFTFTQSCFGGMDNTGAIHFGLERISVESIFGNVMSSKTADSAMWDIKPSDELVNQAEAEDPMGHHSIAVSAYEAVDSICIQLYYENTREPKIVCLKPIAQLVESLADTIDTSGFALPQSRCSGISKEIRDQSKAVEVNSAGLALEVLDTSNALEDVTTEISSPSRVEQESVTLGGISKKWRKSLRSRKSAGIKLT